MALKAFLGGRGVFALLLTVSDKSQTGWWCAANVAPHANRKLRPA